MAMQPQRAESLLPLGEAARRALALRARRGRARRSCVARLRRGASCCCGRASGALADVRATRAEITTATTPRSTPGAPTTTGPAPARWRTWSSAGYLHALPARRLGPPAAGDLPRAPGPARLRRIERRSRRRAVGPRPHRVKEGRTSGGLVEGEGRCDTNRRLHCLVGRAPRHAGLTLVELVIVITIIGVLTAAISVGVMAAKKKADVGTTKHRVQLDPQRHHALEERPPERGLPDGRALKDERPAREGLQPKDPWGNAFKVPCDVDEITCSTTGPDRKEGTEDDIRVPAAPIRRRASDRRAAAERADEGPTRRGRAAQPRAHADRDHRRHRDRGAGHGRRRRGLDAAALGAAARGRPP